MLGEEKNEIEIKKQSSGKSLVGVLLILVSVGVYVFWISPMKANLAVTKTDISSQEALKGILQEKIDFMEKAKSELGLDSEVKRSETLKAIPTEMLQDEVIRDLIKILDKHDVELNSIGFGNSGSEFENIGVLRVTASFDGSYSDLEDFLRSVETNPRIFQVETISVQVDDLATGFKRVGFSLSINVFYQNAE